MIHPNIMKRAVLAASHLGHEQYVRKPDAGILHTQRQRGSMQCMPLMQA